MDEYTFVNQKTKILVIDDEFEIFKVPLETNLRNKYRDWELFWAKSKDEGIEFLAQKEPDIIILDLELTPGHEEGKDILKYIRSNKLNLPVIIFTKSESIADVKETLSRWALAADGYILKKETIESNNYEELRKLIPPLLYKYSRIYNKIGILITHGTDTMAFGFSILRYMLKKIRINIVLTGSQIPLSGFFSSSDGIGNLKTSLFILNRVPPPSISTVFNNGRDVYSNNLRKVRKWDIDAFEGEKLASSIWWDVKTETDIKFIPYKEQLLECLYLIRTGGTIESEKDPLTGALKATGDFVQTYLFSTLQKEFFKELLTPYQSLHKDSSCLIIKDWIRVANWIKEILEKENLPCEIDAKFDWKIRPILLNPFYNKKNYIKFIEKSERGLILLGYGAGNANIEDNEYSIIPALKEAINSGKIVVISSQVPIDDYDFSYEAGRKLIEYGAIPSGNLSFEEAQIRLAYILGHSDEIANIANNESIDMDLLIKAAYVAGIGFRTNESYRDYESISGVKIMPYNPFVDFNKTFKDAILEVAQYQR